MYIMPKSLNVLYKTDLKYIGLSEKSFLKISL